MRVTQSDQSPTRRFRDDEIAIITFVAACLSLFISSMLIVGLTKLPLDQYMGYSTQESLSFILFPPTWLAIGMIMMRMITWLIIFICDNVKLGYQLIKVKPETKTLIKAPGAKLLALVDFLFSPKTVELTFNQLVANWREEYFDALKHGRTKKARWISIRYRFAFACTFIMAIGLSKVFSLFKQLSK